MPNGRTNIIGIRKNELLSILNMLEGDQDVGVRFGEFDTTVRVFDLRAQIDHHESDVIDVEEHGDKAYIIRVGLEPSNFVNFVAKKFEQVQYSLRK